MKEHPPAEQPGRQTTRPTSVSAIMLCSTGRGGDRMSRRLLERIRVAILSGDYDLTRHAIDEMAEDGLGIFDVECAILNGEI